MKIYNSMTHRKEEFIPLKNNEVKMYACGITVYDLSHIGHARQAIVYSMISEYLRYRGYDVTYIRNYTDVDDKIINRANLLNKNALEFSKEQIKETEKDMQDLHVKDADVIVKASEYIEKIIQFVSKLIEKGFAYVTDKGDVYYKVRKFKDYGKLSNRKIDELLNGVRVDIEDGKKDPLDFALWKSAKENEIYWDSPWGKGRPGWHIECSAMALDRLGEQIDIHGGGKDLVFPHHENEIAQTEALTGKEFAKYWTHCGLIRINNEKMSKSLGNSITIRDALKKYNYEVIKYLFLQKHYTTDINIVDSDFSLAENHLYYFYNTIYKMNSIILKNKPNNDDILQDDIPNNIKNNFIKAMDDDFNTPIAISELFSIFKYANKLMKSINNKNIQIISNTLNKILNDIKDVYSILGLLQQDPIYVINSLKEKYLRELKLDKEYIEEKIQERKNAKLNKDYITADTIRNELEEKGIILNDQKDITTWDIKSLYNIANK